MFLILRKSTTILKTSNSTMQKNNRPHAIKSPSPHRKCHPPHRKACYSHCTPHPHQKLQIMFYSYEYRLTPTSTTFTPTSKAITHTFHRRVAKPLPNHNQLPTKPQSTFQQTGTRFQRTPASDYGRANIQILITYFSSRYKQLAGP